MDYSTDILCSSEADITASSCSRRALGVKGDHNNVALISKNPRKSLKHLKIGLSYLHASSANTLCSEDIKALADELLVCKRASTFLVFIPLPSVWDNTANASSVPSGACDIEEDDVHDLLTWSRSNILESHRYFLVNSCIKPRDYKFKAILVIRDCASPQAENMVNMIMHLRVDMPIERLYRIMTAIIPSDLQLWVLREILVLFEHEYSLSECFIAASAALQTHQSLVSRSLQKIGDEPMLKSYEDDSLIAALAVVCCDNNFPCIILSTEDEIKEEDVSQAVKFVSENMIIPENLLEELVPCSWSLHNSAHPS